MNVLNRLFKIIFRRETENNYPVILTLAYVLALSLIALFTFLSHIITNQISDAQLARAEIIYKLRAQNALVLDISGYANDYYNDSMQFDYLFLNQSIDKLAQSHNDISAFLNNDDLVYLGKAHDTLFKYYYDSRFGLSQKLQKYIISARDFTKFGDTSKSPERVTALNKLGKGHERMLVDLLNAAQSDFQRDTIDEIQSIMNLQLYMSAGIILIILLEALFIFRPVIGRLDEYHTMILSQALEDPLTGLGNRRAFYKNSSAFFINIKREEKPFTVALCDLDKFKSVNDTYGHDVGDEVLKNFATLLKSELRPFDIVCRLGGEEFAIVMANTGTKTATHVLDRLIERIRNNICVYQLPNGETGSIKYTTSIGYVIGDPKNIQSMDTYLHDADLALYQAKEKGRNQHIRYESKEDKSLKRNTTASTSVKSSA